MTNFLVAPTVAAGLAMAAVVIGAPGWLVPAAAQEEAQVEGEIVDVTCYLHKGSKGRRHKTCAQMCAEKGLPIGVLTDDGELLLLIEDHDDPEPYEDAKKLAGEKAAIGGKKYTKGSITGIMVQKAKGL